MPDLVLGWLVWLGAAAFGWYAGLHLLVPLGFTAGAWWAGKRISGQSNPFLLAAAVQAGHMAWLLSGLIILRVFDLNVGDVVILAVGVAWLLYKPNLGAVLFLTAYQAVSLGVNVLSFAGAVDPNLQKALSVHVVWRLLALLLMWRAFIASRKAATAEPLTADQ